MIIWITVGIVFVVVGFAVWCCLRVSSLCSREEEK